MSEFKVGDKVRVKSLYSDSVNAPWRTGVTVSKIEGRRVWALEAGTWVDNSEVELVTEDDITKHYGTGDIECVDYLYDNMPREAFIGWLEGSFKKYTHRWRYKENPIKDLRKARDFLSVLIDVLEDKKPEFKEWTK
jgi:hypothetical protein